MTLKSNNYLIFAEKYMTDMISFPWPHAEEGCHTYNEFSTDMS